MRNIGGCYVLTGTFVFLVIGGIGAAVLAIGLILGELFGVLDAGGAVSTETVAGFVGVFGFGAAIAGALLQATTPGAMAVSAGVGVLAAVPATYLIARLSRAARNMHTDHTPERSDLVGMLGVVVTALPERGYGEVRVRLGGQPVKLNARADRPLPRGAQVLVIEAPSDTSVVVVEAPGVPDLLPDPS